MSEHRFSSWRGVVAATLLLGVAVAIMLNWPAPSSQMPASPVASTRAPTPASLAQLQPLDRAALIDAAAIAASAHAAGKPMDRKVADLAGRRFELVLPFGCGGPVPADEKLRNGWRFDTGTEILQMAFPSSLRLREPEMVEKQVRADAESQFSKGFWIEREWLREPICPPTQEMGAIGLEPEASSLAIAELVDADGPRASRRRGEPYRVSKRVAEDAAPDRRGLRIILTGRLAIGDRMPIQCRLVSSDRRPICVILARFDTVAVTDATRTTVHGEWRG